MSLRPKAIAVDIGGVLLRYDFKRAFSRWSELVGRPVPGGLWNIADVFQAFESGQVSTSDFFAAVRRELSINLSDHDICDGWNSVYEGIDRKTYALLRDVRATPVLLVTSTNPLHLQVMRRDYWDQLSRLGSILTTLDVRRPKKSREFLAAVSTHLATPASGIIFIDDIPEMVQYAKSCGFDAVHFAGASQLSRSLHGL